jgi:hypothetical protein
VKPLRLLARGVMGSFLSLVVCCRFGTSALSNVANPLQTGRTAFRFRHSHSARRRVLVRDSVVVWTEHLATLILLEIPDRTCQGCLLGCGLWITLSCFVPSDW